MYTSFYCKQNGESAEGYSRLKEGKRHSKFGNIGLNNSSISKSQTGTKPCVRKNKRSPLACHIHCKCSVETTRNSMKVNLGIKVMEFMKSLIGREVTVTGRGSECHLTFVRGILHIAE